MLFGFPQAVSKVGNMCNNGGMIGKSAPVAALVAYKNKPALVAEKAQDKIVIALFDGEKIKVREKDIEVIHPGPAKGFDGIVGAGSAGANAAARESAAREAWELLLADGGAPVSLRELAELAFGDYSPASAWAAFRLLLDGLFFAGSIDAISPRPEALVAADEKKREEKQREDEERGLFLERLKSRQPFFAEKNPSGDSASSGGVGNSGANGDSAAANSADASSASALRFIQDVEALACGKSAKSRTMKDLGLGETPEEAHALLLDCGFWTNLVNPHPSRFGISVLPAKHAPPPPHAENRADLSALAAFAIDSPWSHDPDDALSLQVEGDRFILYVHVADPAASISADSPCEKEARDRGATLYLPEGNHRMLADEALPLFALGLAESSPALTFKVTLDLRGKIEETEIFPSMVKVSRLTYKRADELISGANAANALFSSADAGTASASANTDADAISASENARQSDAAILRELNSLAQRNLNRRIASGAINIDMPETHVALNDGRVTVEPIVRYQSATLVRECMLLAGEAAGIWAMQRGLPFPCIAQETGELPGEVLPGLAGSYQLRRCMRPRSLSTKPGLHSGLGLDIYTQVTSPLRRYTDLLSHIQIRAALAGAPPLSADELASRMFAGEAAAATVTQAERASRGHWLMVYLSDKKDSVWDAIVLEKRGNRWLAVIPALALETQVSLRGEVAPNDCIQLALKSLSIPAGEAVFAVLS